MFLGDAFRKEFYLWIFLLSMFHIQDIKKSLEMQALAKNMRLFCLQNEYSGKPLKGFGGHGDSWGSGIGSMQEESL